MFYVDWKIAWQSPGILTRGPIKVGCGSTACLTVIRDKAVIKLSLPILKGITARYPIHDSESAELVTLCATLIIAPGTYSPLFRKLTDQNYCMLQDQISVSKLLVCLTVPLRASPLPWNHCPNELIRGHALEIDTALKISGTLFA